MFFLARKRSSGILISFWKRVMRSFSTVLWPPMSSRNNCIPQSVYVLVSVSPGEQYIPQAARPCPTHLQIQIRSTGTGCALWGNKGKQFPPGLSLRNMTKLKRIYFYANFLKMLFSGSVRNAQLASHFGSTVMWANAQPKSCLQISFNIGLIHCTAQRHNSSLSKYEQQIQSVYTCSVYALGFHIVYDFLIAR